MEQIVKMIIQIRVKPNYSEQKIEKIGEEYLVYLKSSAEKNKANIELLNLMSGYFKDSKIKIIRGLKSKNKILEIIPASFDNH